jgi:hypothetical protein
VADRKNSRSDGGLVPEVIGVRPKSRGGRPPYKPTDADKKAVKELILLGTNREKIAVIIGITQPTLEKYYGEMLDNYQSRMLSRVAGKAYGMALDGNPFMVQFVLRTRAGWKENLLTNDETQLIKRVIGIQDANV